MLLISLGTGPFSVGACPWSLCTTAKDKHTLDTGPVIHHRAGRKGTRRPRQMCLFFLSFHLPWLDISSCGESQRPSQENKVMPALTDYTVPSVKGAIEGRSENPASAWAAGNPLSAVARARRTITNVLVHETKKHSTVQFVSQILHSRCLFWFSILHDKSQFLGNSWMRKYCHGCHHIKQQLFSLASHKWRNVTVAALFPR